MRTVASKTGTSLFAITRHTGTAHSCAVAGNIWVRPYTLESCCEALFLTCNAEFVSVAQEAGSGPRGCLLPHLWRVKGMLRVKEKVSIFAF